MRVAIVPSGALLAETAPGDDEASEGLSVAARARIARAFARGPGHALLDLGATELDAPLVPPLAFLRDLGRAFVTRLCARPDLEERRERVEVDCPADEHARLAGAVPPMDGGEYVDIDWVAARWADLNRAFADEICAHRGSVGDWLSARHPSWHVVGKVCLHLAENRGDEEHPFAFLATYAARAGVGGTVQHRPLSRALEESSARGDRQALLHLLVPLQRAAKHSGWLAELVDSGAIYQAMAWTPAEAHRFLHAIPAFEAAGLVVRVSVRVVEAALGPPARTRARRGGGGEWKPNDTLGHDLFLLGSEPIDAPVSVASSQACRRGIAPEYTRGWREFWTESAGGECPLWNSYPFIY